MPNNKMPESKQLKSDLTLHWLITAMMLCMLIIYNAIIYTNIGSEIQMTVEDEQRIVIRSVFYAIAIILFPIVNVLRHILLRLNQTMPGNNPAKNRYFLTIFITLSCIEIVGLFGFIMYIIGDEINSLYIFSCLGLLGVFLHRPRVEEYRQIVEALKVQGL